MPIGLRRVVAVRPRSRWGAPLARLSGRLRTAVGGVVRRELVLVTGRRTKGVLALLVEARRRNAGPGPGDHLSLVSMDPSTPLGRGWLTSSAL